MKRHPCNLVSHGGGGRAAAHGQARRRRIHGRHGQVEIDYEETDPKCA